MLNTVRTTADRRGGPGSARVSIARPLLAGLAAVVFGAAFLGAQQPDETLPGFSPTSLFQSGGIDNVNVYSGDPGIVIPLGPVYTLSPGFTWQLRAYNTSKFWHFETDSVCTGGDGAKLRHAMIYGYPTIGAGWTLDPGYIGPAANASPYHRPDGGQPRGLEAARLRLTTYAAGPQPACAAFPCTTVEFADGSTEVFDHSYTRPVPTYDNTNTSPDFTDEIHIQDNTTRYGLSKIIDRFGHTVLRVNYDAAHPNEFTSFVLYADQSVTINVTWAALPRIVSIENGDPAWRTIQSVSFPVTSGQTLLAAFSYNTSNGGMPRNVYDTSAGVPCHAKSTTTAVPYLTNIAFQSGVTLASYGIAACFSADVPPSGFFGSQYSCDSTDFIGSVKKLTLPTGGAIAYHYGITSAVCSGPAGSCVDPEMLPGGVNGPSQRCRPDITELLFDSSSAVYRREEVDSVGNVLSTVGYVRQDYIPRAGDCTFPFLTDKIARSVTVTANSGDGGIFNTLHIFHVAYFQEGVSQPQDGGMEIERRYFAKNGATSDVPVRTIVKCLTTGPTDVAGICGYRSARDGTLSSINTFHLTGEVREQRSVTWYGDNPTTDNGGTCDTAHAACVASEGSAWNEPAKAYGLSTLRSNLPSADGWTHRDSSTSWNPQTGAHWILDLFTTKTVTDDGGVAPLTVATDYTFDIATGYPQSSAVTDSTYGTRTHSFSATPDALGNPTTATVSGGGGGIVGTFTDGFSFAKNGLLTSTRSGIGWMSFNVVRDPNVGIITSSQSPDLHVVPTTYTYDPLLRIKTLGPPAEAPTSVCYDSLTQTTVYRSASTLTCPVDPANAAVLTWQQYRYDSLGRLVREIRRMPAGFSLRTHAFDSADHATFDSEWTSCAVFSGDCLSAAPPGTTRAGFDPFSRPTTVTKADTTQSTVSRDDGAIQFSDSLQAVTTSVASAPSITTTRYDALARIIAVTEPDAGSGADVTNYSYNVLDKLGKVYQGAQTRTFEYDASGFLRRETTPEKGLVTYDVYNALGNLASESRGTIALTRVYDAAGRLQKIAAGSHVYLRSCYDGQMACVDSIAGFVGGTSPLGHLTRSVGYNPLSNPSAVVTQDFTYSDSSGRVSGKLTSFAGILTPVSSPSESWSYNNLGLVSFYTHPSGAVEATSYSSGFPTNITMGAQTVVSSITYQPAGGLGGYTTGNGVVTTIALDDAKIARPKSYTAMLSGSTLFSSGNYFYDGTGNVLSIGAHVFGYDTRSRLTSAAIFDQLSGAPLGTQAYSYDRYGNLTQRGALVLPISAAANNQLADGTYLQGNLVGYGCEALGYDEIDRQIREQSLSYDRAYLFDGAGERIGRVVNNPGPTAITFTIRGLSNRLTTEFADNLVWRDNVFLGNQLVGSFVSQPIGEPVGWKFFSGDHLGSPRLVTDASGSVLDRRQYWPYGDDVAPGATGQRLGFASMERDPESNHYYDHARTHDFDLGRFLSADVEGGRVAEPASWNRYSYSGNNPLRYKDTDGRLKHGADGELVFTPVGYRFASHKAAPGRSSLVQMGYLYTDSGSRVEAFKNKSSDTCFNTDCHGLSFTKGKYFIQNDQVDKILGGDKYHPTKTPQVGDIGVYRDKNGDVAHSVTVTQVDDGKVTAVAGLGGVTAASKETTPEAAWQGEATLEYYHKDDDSRSQVERDRDADQACQFAKPGCTIPSQ